MDEAIRRHARLGAKDFFDPKAGSFLWPSQHVGEILDLVWYTRILVDYGKNKLPPGCHLVADRKSLWMLNVFGRGRSQLFPGTKILKKD